MQHQKYFQKTQSKLRNHAKKVMNQKSAIGALAEGSPKQQFIDKYGIELQMPANYIYEAIFYKPDLKYVITSHCQVFPQDVEFLDYDKIHPQDDPYDNDYLDNELDISNCLSFKVYAFDDDKYHQIKFRTCLVSYQHKLCFSEDRTKVAIFRLQKATSTNKEPNTFQKYVIDVFDCSSIDFFLRDEPLSPEDPNLLFTIADKQLNSAQRFENSFMRFSAEKKYLYIIQSRKTFLIYDLQKREDKQINDHSIMISLPSIYECILNVAVDEYDINETLIAAKKAEFRNIDIFPLEYLNNINEQFTSSSRPSINTKEINRLKEKYPISSIRLSEFNLSSTNIRFSADHTQVIYCDNNQNIILELAQEGIKQHQKTINHLNGKICRSISKFGDSEFLIATANSQDKEIGIRHSSDPDKKIKFYFRYSEGTVDIRDLISYDNKVRVLVTRDDEEFIIYEWQDFQEKEIFWQRFFESSNYIFEWPYLCYLKGQKHIIIQNAFQPNIAMFIEIKGLKESEMISNMFLTDQYLLYVVIQTKEQYLIYEKDLDKCMPYILNYCKQDNSKQISPDRTPNRKLGNQLTSYRNQDTPLATISKTYINQKSIYKFFVRSPSTKEIIQTNLERIIFFLCDFKIYCIIGSKITIVDSGYKFRTITPNLIAYNTVDNRGRKTNELKYLSIAHSDYQITKVFEETEGKLLEFLVQEGNLLVLLKPEKSEKHLIKIYDVNNTFQIKLKCQIYTDDEELIGNIQTLNYYQNNMIPAFNDIYTLIFNGDETLIHHYKQVLPILPNSGNKMQFYSPVLNQTYRKMLYFLTNKQFLKPKRAIIIPYITDNFTLFNKRTNLTQICQFYEYKSPLTLKKETEIMCLVPFTRQALHYNLKGQIVNLQSLNETYENYGDNLLAMSPNGNFYLQNFDDESDHDHLFITQIQITEEHMKDSLISSPIFNEESPRILNAKQLTQKLLDNKQNPPPNKSIVQAKLIEDIKLDEIEIEDEFYKKINQFFLSNLIEYFQSRQCEVVYKINNNLDVVIGFIYTSQTKKNETKEKVLKELLIVKNNGLDKKRSVYKVRLNISLLKSDNQEIEFNQDDIRKRLLGDYMKNDKAVIEDQEYALFLATTGLRECYDFTLTNDKVIVWSKKKIYHGELDLVNSNTHTIHMHQCKFQIKGQEESYIQAITATGQNDEDKKLRNYYIYIKIIVENSYAFVLKYNINKNKEFASFDCSIESQVFFDTKHEGFILDTDSIIDVDQGIPLYFYKTSINEVNKQYLLNGVIDKGSRFCSSNTHFMIRNKFFLPYSYFILILLESNKGMTLNNENYDPTALFFYNGQTLLHYLSNNYKGLEFVLNKYEQSNPSLLNMIFLKNGKERNVLQLAIECGNTRCVKLILDKLSLISMNNIHAIKENFTELLGYNGFEDYLKLCFFTTKQMQSKQIFSRKCEDQNDSSFIHSHSTTFLDKEFYQNFEATDQTSKQVLIRCLDAGWIIKHGYGLQFQIKLSESENMDYFAIDTIKLVVKYQWLIMKPLIIKWLFIPFIFNMTLYNIYCTLTFENHVQAQQESDGYDVFNYSIQIILLLFTIHTVTVEYKQIIFHKKEYLQSFWNILDLTTVILAPLTVILDLCKADPSIIRPIMACCNLIFYMRFFYFLRIFDSSAHLVRTIIEITSDIKNFLFVFFLGVVGFGASFQILSNNNDPNIENAQFISTFMGANIYAYRIALGDFQLDGLDLSTDRYLIWFMFVICSLFSTIILLNMLVAIMGESFNRVNEQSENQRVREHLQLIVENDFLIERKKIFNDVKYLIEIKDDAEEVEQDKVLGKIDSVYQELNEQRQTKKELKELIKMQYQQISQMKNDVTKMKEMMRKVLLSSCIDSQATLNQTLTSGSTLQTMRER